MKHGFDLLTRPCVGRPRANDPTTRPTVWVSWACWGDRGRACDDAEPFRMSPAVSNAAKPSRRRGRVHAGKVSIVTVAAAAAVDEEGRREGRFASGM